MKGPVVGSRRGGADESLRTSTPMTQDHVWIDDEQIAERYVLGRLTEDEAERFEEHYLHCEACLERIEAAEGLHRGLTRVATEEVAAVQTGLAAVLARWSRSRLAPWAASLALLVVVLLPSGVLWQERGRLADELDRARSEASEVESRSRNRSARIGELEAEVERLADRADAERQRREALRRQVEILENAPREPRERPSPRPTGNTTIVTLGPERSSGAEPSVRLTLPDAAGWVVVALEVEPPEASTYRVVLESPGGDAVWRGSGLTPDALGTVNLSVPAEILTPGVWTLRLQADSDAGSSTPAGVFPLRIRR